MNTNFGTTLTTRWIPCAHVVLSWGQHFIASVHGLYVIVVKDDYDHSSAYAGHAWGTWVRQDRFLYGMVYCDFLPESVKIWVLVGLLGTCYRVQAFN